MLRTFSRQHISFVELSYCAAVLLLSVILNSSLANDYYGFYPWIMMGLVFFLTAVSMKMWPSGTHYLLLLLCFGWMLFETGYGLLQIFNINHSASSRFAVYGSFKNPGPYGGFISIVVSIFGAIILNRNSRLKRSKLFFGTVATVVVLMLCMLPATQSRSAILAFVCSCLLFLIYNKGINCRALDLLKRYWLLIAVGFVLCGAGLYLYKKPSADARLFKYKICLSIIKKQPLKGVGIGYFGGAYGQAQSEYFRNQILENGTNNLDWTVIDDKIRRVADYSDGAYNEYLQIGVESGIIGALLMVMLMVCAIVVSLRRDTVWCYGLLALAVFALFSYPLHMTHFRILLAVLAAACVFDRSDAERSHKPERLSLVYLIPFLLLFSAYLTVKMPEIRRNNQLVERWKANKRWYDMGYYDSVIEDFVDDIPLLHHNKNVLFACGRALNLNGEYLKSDSVLQYGTMVSSDPMFWNVMGNNSLALGRFREAEERYMKAFYMVPNRLYPLTLLARLYHTEGDTARFFEMAGMVETFKPKIESANTERLRDEIRELKAFYDE